MTDRIRTDQIPDSASKNDTLQIYNALDCCITQEVYTKIKDQLDPETTAKVYRFERELQAPALEMSLRGVRVDIAKRQEWINHYRTQHERLTWMVQKYTEAVCDQHINPNSPDQLKALFYDVFCIKPITKFEKGERKVSVDNAALKKLAQYYYAGPIARAMLSYRDIDRKLKVLQSSIDSDNRFRPQFKVAGTETGRWASGPNPLGTGQNAQNITEALRPIFVADPGMKIAYADLSQAEARAVAYLSGDENYIAACESGDVHTMVAKMVWPELDWTGDLAHDKKVAEQLYMRHFSYRDIAKRGQHGTNYMMTVNMAADQMGVDKKTAQEFHDRYFAAFPGIRRWHKRVIRQIQTQGVMTTPVGRRRRFWGRKDNNETWKEAVAFGPQSLVGDLMNIGLLKVWKHEPRAQLLLQVHDAILFQYKEEEESDVLPSVLSLLETPVETEHGVMQIPADASVGWNWGKHKVDSNPDGQLELEGPDSRTRQNWPSDDLLDTVL